MRLDIPNLVGLGLDLPPLLLELDAHLAKLRWLAGRVRVRAPVAQAVPAKVPLARHTVHVVASAVLLDERVAHGTPLAVRHALLLDGRHKVVVDLELVVVVGHLRALGRKVGRRVAAQAHLVAAHAAHRSEWVRVQVDLEDLAFI